MVCWSRSSSCSKMNFWVLHLNNVLCKKKRIQLAGFTDCLHFDVEWVVVVAVVVVDVEVDYTTTTPVSGNCGRK